MSSEYSTPPVLAQFPDLKGNVAIVTGASQGIGRAIAVFLASQGMKVVANSRREEPGPDVLADIQGVGGEGLWVAADTSSTEGAEKVFQAAMQTFGRVDVLVSSAADKSGRRFLETDDDSYHRSFEKNVRAIFKLSQLVARQMVESNIHGSIIHISSVGGLRPHRGTAAYDMSKAAIDHMARIMALDLGANHIRVNVVAPGFTPTEAQIAKQKEKRPEGFKARCEGIPIPRPGTGWDCAAAVAFLASDAASYITGQVLYVDGGLTTQMTPKGINI